MKPSVSLVNEANYSDGHCYAYTYKALRIGPLVGMPVPGTCTFAGWELLQEGLRWGVPGLGVKDSTTGKYLENLQTEPREAHERLPRGRQGEGSAARSSGCGTDEVDSVATDNPEGVRVT